MTRRRLLLITSALFYFSGVAGAAGTASGAFLKLGVGARNVAMGETGAAESGIYSLYWNPAGLSNIETVTVSFMHALWLDGITFQQAAYAQRMEPCAVGISATYLSMPAIDKYDRTGVKQNSTYTPTDMALAFSLARNFETVPVGATIKFISSSIDDKTAMAVAADVGACYDIAYSGAEKKIRLGLAVQNIGTPMKFETESFPLPLNVKLGAACSASDHTVIALDLNKAVDSDVTAHVGAEYALQLGGSSSLAGRLGYKTNARWSEGLTGITAGIGISINRLGLDYAFVPYGDLDTTHRISISLGF